MLIVYIKHDFTKAPESLEVGFWQQLARIWAGPHSAPTTGLKVRCGLTKCTPWPPTFGPRLTERQKSPLSRPPWPIVRAGNYLFVYFNNNSSIKGRAIDGFQNQITRFGHVVH